VSVTVSPIIGPSGEALPSAPIRQRAQALAGMGYRVPYDAASMVDPHMEAWQPWLGSPDGELNPYRDKIVARVRDLVRNDGWASGTITRVLDNAIGATYRPVSKPDYRALAAVTGNKRFDATWADEYGRAADATWRMWAEDPGHHCDAQRRMSFRQMARVAFRHEIVDGDSLAIMMWLPKRVGPGRARYATAVRLVDPDRLSNPNFSFDTQDIRGGVEVDENEAAVAYHIRKAHQGDWWNAAKSMTWERILKEDDFGRARVVHNFTADRANQHRGGAGILTPVIARLKMLVKYDNTELDAAIINAIFGAYVESPFDPQLVTEAMGGDGGLGDAGAINGYQALRSDFHKERRIAAGNVVMPIMFPGEKIATVSATRPASNFKDFEGAVLRNVASGAGVSAQQVSNNWSDVNYSSARGALLEAWKTMDRRSADFGDGWAGPVRMSVMEEMHDRDDLPMPTGGELPDFMEMRAAFARCRWMRPPRGWMDPTKEIEASIMAVEGGFGTLESECAAQGIDWEDVVDQRVIEVARYKAAGIPLPGKVEKAEATAAEPEPAAGGTTEKAV
jgi:lambda family phage portal protein